MNIIFLLFFIVIMLYVIFVDIFTILFRLTGLSEEKARFQVISLLTNSGFTTNESEIIASAKIRRKLAKTIMLFGYAFTATIVSSIVSILVSLNSYEVSYSFYRLLLLLIIFIAFILIRQLPFVKNHFDTLIEKFYLKYIIKERINPLTLIEDYKTQIIASIFINDVPPLLIDKTLAETNIKKLHNILILLIKRADGTILFADADTVIKKYDHVILMGNPNNIHLLFNSYCSKLE